jgi:hypothetical protein
MIKWKTRAVKEEEEPKPVYETAKRNLRVSEKEVERKKLRNSLDNQRREKFN